MKDSLRKLSIGIFASGRGSNFQAILNAIEGGHLKAEITLLISNKNDAGVISIAGKYSIPIAVIIKKEYPSREHFVRAILSALKQHGVDLVLLAGYMKRIPPEVVAAYRNRILNIHPALLPSFGGKGMYGHYVHEAVLSTGCKVTGVTVHIVDDVYDHGPIVAQRCVPVEDNDTPETLAARVLMVEHKIYSEVLQLFVEGRIKVRGQKVFIKR